MLPMLPQIAWTGISISVYTGLLVPIIIGTLPEDYDESMRFEMSMFAMVSLGLGEIFGGIVMGIIVDKIGAKRSSLINVLLVMAQTAAVLVYIIRG